MTVSPSKKINSNQSKISQSTLYRRLAMKQIKDVFCAYRNKRNEQLLLRAHEPQDILIPSGLSNTNQSERFTVTVKTRSSGNSDYVIEYSKKDLPQIKTNADRDKLLLPRVDSSQLEMAKKISLEFQKILNKNKHTNTIESIRPLYKQALDSIHPEGLQNSIELEALVYGICIADPQSGLSALPRGYIRHGEDLISQLRTLARYVFSEKNNILKPQDLTQITSWKKFLQKDGINFSEYLTVKDLLKLTYPGWLEGERPLIRPHTLTLTGNYSHTNGEDTSKPSKAAAAAARCVFLDQDGVLDDRGFYVPSRIIEIDWHNVYRDKITGIPNLVQDPDSKQFGRIYDAFEIAAPNLVGTKPGQIPPWRLSRYLTWKNTEEANKNCQDILRYVLAQAPALDCNGRPIAAKVRTLTLGDLIAQQSSMAMNKSSYKNTYELFQATYPDLVGWKFDQINPGDIPYDGIWQGKEGLNIVKNRFAKGIYELFEALKADAEPDFLEHGVFFDPEAEKFLEISRQEMHKLKLYMHRKGISWKDLAVAFGIQSPFEERFNGSTKKFFEGIFGKADAETFQLGKSGIYLDDVSKKITGHDDVVDQLGSELDSLIKAPDVIYQGEGNLLKLLKDLNSSRKDRDSYIRKLYIAFAASKSSKLVSDSSLGDSVLAKVLTAKKKNSKEYYLSARSFNGIMELMLLVLLDRSNLSPHLKKITKEQIYSLIVTKERRNALRERLIDCIKRDPSFKEKNNLVSLINRNLELCFAEINKYEKSFKKLNNRTTSLYERVVKNLDNKARKES
jgi:hypothetical protein